MNRFGQQLKVLRKILSQSWIPAVLALAYAVWEIHSLPLTQQTLAGLVKSWGVTFFLIMWYAGQWLRASKQISDQEQLETIQGGIDKSLTLLHKLTEAAVSETPSAISQIASSIMPGVTPPVEEPIERVLHEMQKSPKGALILLGSDLERELRHLLWGSGWFLDSGPTTIRKSVDHLVSIGLLPKALGRSVRGFLQIRSRLIHGYGITDDELFRAIDIGITILRAVVAIPMERNHVYHPGLDVYEDSRGEKIRDGIKAVVLETTKADGSKADPRVYPTTLTNYKKGQHVSWEWDTSVVVGKSWFRHPDTGQIALAWDASTAFIGRNLEEI
jgi:hypothetical protein